MKIQELEDAGLLSEDFDDGYYHLGEDLEAFPQAWLYVIWSARGPGKTYSALWYMVKNKIPFIYMKRTNDDVRMLCSDDGAYSPFKPINRDKGCEIMPVLIREGIGGFYETDIEGKPEGKPLGYIFSFAKASQIKGFDVSEVDIIIMDEFIPIPGQIIKKKEADSLLSIYMTVRRDRVSRGRQDLKLVLLANGSNISTPITNGLGIVDNMAEIAASDNNIYFNDKRDIFFHHIVPGEFSKADAGVDAGIAKAMSGTKWALTELEGRFGYNDFSNVCNMSLKGMKPYLKLHYNASTYFYIYYREWDSMFYMTKTRNSMKVPEYDLDKENDQKLFWMEYGIDLRMTCIEGRMKFQKYSMYDLIVNYKNYFTI